jgi:hypothetical protein
VIPRRSSRQMARSNGAKRRQNLAVRARARKRRLPGGRLQSEESQPARERREDGAMRAAGDAAGPRPGPPATAGPSKPDCWGSRRCRFGRPLLFGRHAASAYETDTPRTLSLRRWRQRTSVPASEQLRRRRCRHRRRRPSSSPPPQGHLPAGGGPSSSSSLKSSPLGRWLVVSRPASSASCRAGLAPGLSLAAARRATGAAPPRTKAPKAFALTPRSGPPSRARSVPWATWPGGPADARRAGAGRQRRQRPPAR